jgi:excinuclease UvrABC nuclease subunit
MKNIKITRKVEDIIEFVVDRIRENLSDMVSEMFDADDAMLVAEAAADLHKQITTLSSGTEEEVSKLMEAEEIFSAMSERTYSDTDIVTLTIVRESDKIVIRNTFLT